MWGKQVWTGTALLAALLMLAGGCGGEEGPPGSIASTVPLAATVARLDDHRWLGEPLTLGNLTVWSVHTDQPLDVGEFLTLPEAEGRGLAAVREVGSGGGGQQRANVQQVVLVDENDEQVDLAEENAAPQPPNLQPPNATSPNDQIRQTGDVQQLGQVLGGGGAQVNTLVIENKGDLPILVCAGTIVKGGQQDRQIGQDFVIAAKSTVPVDAFCVEQGRWSVSLATGSPGFGFTSAGQGMAVKSVRASAQFEKDQGKVWEEVGKVLKDNDIAGTTTLVAANEDVEAKVLERRAALQKQVEDHFAGLASGGSGPIGFAYAIDGKPVTVRAFAHERLLRGHLPAFVQAMCLEAELADRGREEGVVPPAAAAEDVVAMVRALAEEAQERRELTQAANINVYRTTQAGFNGACVVEAGDGTGPDKVVITEDWTAR